MLAKELLPHIITTFENEILATFGCKILFDFGSKNAAAYPQQ
jgi:hypothetical protein